MAIQLREQRKIDLENHVKAVNDALKKAEDVLQEDDDEDGDVWGGLGDEESAHIAEVEGREDEYIDEDKYTTVTVEPMALRSDEEVESDENEEAEDEENATEEGDAKAKPKSKANNADPDVDGVKKKRIWTKEKPEKPDKKKAPKPKKSKFRYETKSERKNNKNKARLKNKAKAMERKEGEKKK